ncbi:hypothetical protein [Hydrocarboniphaga effusa]|uniref:hypothetical protein n=1 Tax=Hydrocarboniphaga effusa TaxID=243629 RepID=UPI00398BD0A7
MLRQGGWTLIELMLSLSLGLIVTGSALALLMTTLATSRDALDLVRLNQDVRHLVNSMQRDFLRAGYWQAMDAVAHVSARCDLQILDAGAGSLTVRAIVSGDGSPCSAFGAPLSADLLPGRGLVISQLDPQGQPVVKKLRIETVVDASRLMVAGSLALPLVAAGSWTIDNPFSTIAQTGDCLVFGYDEDGDGRRSDQEWFGYRLDAGAHAVRGVNNARNCQSGDWENISDERTVAVSALRLQLPFSVLQTGAGTDLRRNVATLQMEASLKRDARADRQPQARARIRNDAQAW